jgi:multiple sugar transport system substrate-binding protein
VRATPKVPEWERIATELKLVSEKAAHGELTSDQAVAELDKRADEILAKRRWILARKKQVGLLRTEARS